MRWLGVLVLSSTLLLANLFDFQIIQKANRAYAEGEYEKSALLFGTLIKKEKAIVAYNRANALYKAQRYDDALMAYVNAKGVDEVARLYNMGNSYFHKNELNRAIEYYEGALRLREDADARHNLELAQRKKEEAEKKNSSPKKKEKKKKKKKKKKPQPKKRKSNKKEDVKKKIPQGDKSDEMRKRELKHMINQLSKNKMPTLMYQSKKREGGDDEQNPW